MSRAVTDDKVFGLPEGERSISWYNKRHEWHGTGPGKLRHPQTHKTRP